MRLQLHYYLLQLYQVLECTHKEKRKTVKFVASNMKEYMYDHPRCSFRELVKYFGEPEEVAIRYLPEGATLKKKFLRSKPILRMVVYTFCWLVLILAVFFLALFLLQHFAPAIPVITK